MKQFLLCGAAIGALLLSSCTSAPEPVATTPAPVAQVAEPAPAPKPDPAAFLAAAEKELMEYADYAYRIAWVNANFITDDTDWLNAWAGSAGTLISVRLANETKKFEGVAMTPEQKRKMDFLKAGMVMPAPSTGTPEQQKAVADELNTIMTDLQSTYGKGKVDEIAGLVTAHEAGLVFVDAALTPAHIANDVENASRATSIRSAHCGGRDTAAPTVLRA